MTSLYLNNEPCVTDELHLNTSSGVTMSTLLKDGHLGSCLMHGMSVRLRVFLIVQRSPLLRIRVSGHFQGCSPIGGMAMIVVTEYHGVNGISTIVCSTLETGQPDECEFHCPAVTTRYVFLEISPRKHHPGIQICEIYVAWYGMIDVWYQ